MYKSSALTPGRGTPLPRLGPLGATVCPECRLALASWLGAQSPSWALGQKSPARTVESGAGGVSRGAPGAGWQPFASRCPSSSRAPRRRQGPRLPAEALASAIGHQEPGSGGGAGPESGYWPCRLRRRGRGRAAARQLGCGGGVGEGCPPA